MFDRVSVILGEHDQSKQNDCIKNFKNEEECAFQDIEVESWKLHEKMSR